MYNSIIPTKITILNAIIIFFLFCFFDLSFTFASSKSDVLIMAHRGAEAFAPENTIESIRLADKMGYDGVEIDLRMSADGQMFLMHDNTLTRTIGHDGSIETMSFSEIKKLLIDTSHFELYKNKKVKIPTLNEALYEIAKTDMIVNIDCSKGGWQNNDQINQVVSLLKKYNVYYRSFFVATNSKDRQKILSLYPDACVSWIYDPNTQLSADINKIKKYKKALLSVPEQIATDKIVDQLNSSGVYYQVYNVNNQKRFDALKAKKTPMIETGSVKPKTKKKRGLPDKINVFSNGNYRSRKVTITWNGDEKASKYVLNITNSKGNKKHINCSSNKYTLTGMKRNNVYEFSGDAIKETGIFSTLIPGKNINRCFFAIAKHSSKAGKHSITIKPRKNKTASGFEIHYSTNKILKSKKIKRFYSKGGKKLKIKHLRKRKNYYYKIRPFKVFNGKTYHGLFSGTHKLRTR